MSVPEAALREMAPVRFEDCAALSTRCFRPLGRREAREERLHRSFADATEGSGGLGEKLRRRVATRPVSYVVSWNSTQCGRIGTIDGAKVLRIKQLETEDGTTKGAGLLP